MTRVWLTFPKAASAMVSRNRERQWLGSPADTSQSIYVSERWPTGIEPVGEITCRNIMWLMMMKFYNFYTFGYYWRLHYHFDSGSARTQKTRNIFRSVNCLCVHDRHETCVRVTFHTFPGPGHCKSTLAWAKKLKLSLIFLMLPFLRVLIVVNDCHGNSELEKKLNSGQT